MATLNKKLIINADDFGMTPGITQGIIDAHRRGVVTSTTALVPAPYFDEAMRLACIEAPTLAVGIHLTLTLRGARPVLPASEVPSLVDDDGFFLHNKTFETRVDLDEVYREWDAQITRFTACGRMPDHIDSHHNVHGRNADLLDVALELARTYHLPVRYASRSPETESFMHRYGTVPTTDGILHQFSGVGVSMQTFEGVLDDMLGRPGSLYEINAHPAFIDHLLRDNSSYCMPRIDEHAILTSPQARQALADRSIILTNYAMLQG